MAFNGSGVFVRLYNWVNDAAGGIKIRADRMDAEIDGLATGLSNCVTKDGQTTVTANLPMATFKHTGVGNASLRNQYLAYGQAMDGSATYAAAVGGTADVITLTFTPVFPAYVAGMEISFLATGTNTTNVTVNVDGLGAKAITKTGTTALVAGDITSGDLVTIQYDGTRFQLKSVVRVSSASETAAGIVELATDAEAQTGTDTARAITPANLQAVTATEARKGVVELATDAEAQTGTDTARAITPANLQAVTATEARKGVIELLTDAEFITGTDAGRAVLVSNFVKSLAEDGYIKLPGGLIIQWGKEAGNVSSVSFPTAFSTAVYSVIVSSAEALSRGFAATGPSTTGFTAHQFNTGSGAGTTDCDYYWFAIGK